MKKSNKDTELRIETEQKDKTSIHTLQDRDYVPYDG